MLTSKSKSKTQNKKQSKKASRPSPSNSATSLPVPYFVYSFKGVDLKAFI